MAEKGNGDDLKKEIAKIMRDSSVSQAEKSRRIQALMSRGWAARAAALEGSSEKNGGDDKDKDGDDREATLAAVAKVMETPSYFDDAHTIFGCKHYMRDCRIRAKCCGKVYPCRLCHDEAEEGHQINRFETEEVVCCRCKTLQGVSNACVSEECRGKPFAKYFCAVCKLWDGHPDKKIYHCDKCGICRIGEGLGIDRTHCDVCCCCYPTSYINDHKCTPKMLNQDCPVCRAELFSSTRAVVFMPCGHPIHQHCMNSLSRAGNYRCPTCNKSMGDMSAVWEGMDEYIRRAPMPAEWAETRASCHCNDCGTIGETQFHFAGLKCPKCNGYNTTMVSLINPPTDEQIREASRRIREEALQSQQQPQADGQPLPEPEVGEEELEDEGDGEDEDEEEDDEDDDADLMDEDDDDAEEESSSESEDHDTAQ